MSFAHQSTPPCVGVTDHGLLTGLLDDDHAQYALADKSRPDPWVAAADLSPRSLADLGTKAHDLLDGLGDDDHSIYALLAGRSGGQAFVGGAAASEHLTLQSTAHASRGYVRAQDDLQLLSNVMRDSVGTNRLELDNTSPHIALTGDLEVSAHAAIGPNASVTTLRALTVDATLDTHPASAAYCNVVGNKASGVQLTYGIMGFAHGAGTPSLAYIYGLYFGALHETASACGYVLAQALYTGSAAAGTGAITDSAGILVNAGNWQGSKPTTTRGLELRDQGNAAVTTAYGVKVDDQTAATVRLLELGPAVPYLRLVGGGDPAAGDTNLYLKVGGTLKQVYVAFDYLKVK